VTSEDEYLTLFQKIQSRQHTSEDLMRFQVLGRQLKAAGTLPDVGGPITSQLEGTAGTQPPYVGLLEGGQGVPLWQAWGGPRTNPEVGMNVPRKMPHEINYGDFLRLTPTEQQMAFADWEALGMAPDTAFEIMRRSAMRGTARAGVGYG